MDPVPFPARDNARRRAAALRAGACAAALTLVGSHALADPTPPTAPKLAIVQFVSADISKVSVDDTPIDTKDLYTKLVVRDADSDDNSSSDPSLVRDYAAERRNWLSRLLIHTTIHVSEIVSVSVKDPEITQTVPLFAIDHDSARDTGDVYSTSLTTDDVSSALFRIGANTQLTLHFHEDVNNDGKSDAASTIIQAVKTAVNIAAPTSTLLTTLSKSDISNASTAIDAALGGLMTQSIAEDVAIGKLVENYLPGTKIIITGRVPSKLVKRAERDDKTGRLDHDPSAGAFSDYTVGRWALSLACPRPSYFSPRDICTVDVSPDKAAHTSAKPAPPQTSDAVLENVSKIRASIVGGLDTMTDLILGADLSAQVTVEDFIMTQSWYTTYVSKGNDATADDRKTLCSSALDALYKQGLNQFDAELVLYAMNANVAGVSHKGVANDCAAYVSDPEIKKKFAEVYKLEQAADAAKGEAKTQPPANGAAAGKARAPAKKGG